MKRFICGFLIGAMLFGAIGAFAASYVANPVSFKVLVNGEEFTSDPPPVEINGRTYLPLRAIGDALGVPVNWNEELFQAEVGMISSQKDTTINGYKTYEDGKDVIDYGDFCGVSPCKENIVTEKYVGYVYDYDTTNKLLDYIEVMEENGYSIVDSQTGLFNSYYLKDIDNSKKTKFAIGFGQPDTSSLDMYVIITIYK